MRRLDPAEDLAAAERRAIVVLPDHVVNQIAAGEVVERPASVVKELVENALDAGATHVTVEVEDGGKRCIRVLDNGHGMSASDARLALTRHATSKLRVVDDLFALASMGFRGEALPSIAAVSRLTLITRSNSALAATRLELEGGRVVDEAEVGAPIGTQLEVRELLFNVPARLKFLKGTATEAAHITDVMQKLAMAHPEVHFRLRHGQRTALEAPRHPDGFERARALLGARQGRGLHRVAGQEGGIAVTAYLAAPELAQSTSRAVQLFVGRRAVRDRGLLHALQMGYGELVPKGRYPLAVVFVELPGGAVDVNVHPQKLEVRFSDPQAVHAAVRHVVRAGVAAAPWLGDGPPLESRVRLHAYPPAVSERPRASALAAGHAAHAGRVLSPLGRSVQQTAFPLAATVPSAGAVASAPPTSAREAKPEWPRNRPRSAAREGASDVAGEGPENRLRSDAATGTDAVQSPPAGKLDEGANEAGGLEFQPASQGAAQPFFARLRYLGQLDRSYLVCEASGEMVLIDQHAAHERVAYERLRARYQQHEVPTQRLLFAETLELDETAAAAVDEHRGALAALGFELEPFGGSTVAVKTVPVGLRDGAALEVVRELLDDLRERGGSAALQERLDVALATIACHSVVRAGDVLEEREVHALLAQMDEVDCRANCPHGRPVLLRIGITELARRFGRSA